MNIHYPPSPLLLPPFPNLDTLIASLILCMQDSEVLLCRLRHVGQLAGFLSAITAATLHMGGQCTNLWRTGTISYRCRTCQLTSASAICPPCFQVSEETKRTTCLTALSVQICCMQTCMQILHVSCMESACMMTCAAGIVLQQHSHAHGCV